MSRPLVILVLLVTSILGAFAGGMIAFGIVALILSWLYPQDPGATEPALLGFYFGSFVGFIVSAIWMGRYLDKKLERPQPRGFPVLPNVEHRTPGFERPRKNPHHDPFPTYRGRR
jgi:hypothetical protein